MVLSLSKYYEVQRTAWLTNARIAIQTFDAVAIHDFRTTNKRLHTLFPFLGMLCEKRFEGKDQLRAFKVFYQHIGRIRELQMEQLLMQEYENRIGENAENYIAYLSRLESGEMSTFSKAHQLVSFSDSSLPDVQSIEILEKENQSMMAEFTRLFYQIKMMRIKQLIHKPVKDAHIHALRRHLKQLYYFEELTEDSTLDTSFEKISVERLRELEQFIGNWHDLVNSQRFMQNYSRTKAFKSSTAIQHLRNAISNDRADMRSRIVQEFYPEFLRV